MLLGWYAEGGAQTKCPTGLTSVTLADSDVMRWDNSKTEETEKDSISIKISARCENSLGKRSSFHFEKHLSFK